MEIKAIIAVSILIATGIVALIWIFIDLFINCGIKEALIGFVSLFGVVAVDCLITLFCMGII